MKRLIVTGIVFLAGLASALAAWAKPPENFVYDAHGQRDPFLPLISSGGAIINYDSNLSVSEMALEGIIADGSGTGALAIINGNIVEAGGQMGAYKILKIEEDRVILEKDGQTSMIQLKKEE